jgi:crotonobetaine/carnitine-CoA ligase
VVEFAALGVPSELGEEEVLVAVVARSGVNLALPELYQYACERLAPLKRPRYLVSVDSLPHTGSMKIAKFRLKPDLKDLVARAADFSPSSSS